jgi:hypothetical protein
MSRTNGLVELETRSGEPVVAGDVTVTPESRAFTLRWPGGGFVWNRPVALLVEGHDGEERIPIVDVTLLAQVLLLGLGSVFGLVALILTASQRRK